MPKFSRLLPVGAIVGYATWKWHAAVAVSSRQLSDIPLVFQEKQPSRFVAGEEKIHSFIPDSMNIVQFYAFTTGRMITLLTHLVPMAAHFALSVLRGDIILTIRRELPNGTTEVKDEWLSDMEIAPEYSSIVRWRLPGDSYLYDMMLQLLKSMGPAYIKMGQWAASRPDIFPEGMITKLSELFDDAPVHPWEYTARELQRHGLLEHLENIDVDPMNSGSVGQVHRATLKTSQHIEPSRNPYNDAVDAIVADDSWTRRMLARVGFAAKQKSREPSEIADLPRGTPVVVKILHPGVKDLFLADGCVVRWLAYGASKLPGFHFLSLRESADEIAALLLSQLDLRRECHNLLAFRHNFITCPNVKFPVPVPQLSSGSILVESFEMGTPIANIVPSSEIAQVLFHTFLKMMFRDNFIHADLHPGNLLIRYRRPDGTLVAAPERDRAQMNAGNIQRGPKRRHENRSVAWLTAMTVLSAASAYVRAVLPLNWLRRLMGLNTLEVVFLDPGLVTSLSARERSNFVSLCTAIVVGDGYLAGQLLLKHSTLVMCPDAHQFYMEMKDLFDYLLPKCSKGMPKLEMEHVQFSYVVTKAFQTMRKHKVRVEGAFASLVSAFVVGEGLGRMMNPDFNMLAASVPYLLTYLQQHEMMALVAVLSGKYKHVNLE